MVAMQISHDPLVRQAVRQTFYERAKLLVRPTKKGIKVRKEECLLCVSVCVCVCVCVRAC